MAKQPRSLEQLLTFDRASAAGYFGRDGKYVWQEKSRNKISLPVRNWLLVQDFSSIPAPDGSLTAVDRTQSTGASGVSSIYLIQTSFERCFSGYVYAPDHDYLYMSFRWAGTNALIFFDKAALSAINPPEGVTAGIQDAGEGWYRIYASHETKYSGSNASLYLGATDTVGSGSSVLDGRPLHFWGAQLEDADFPTPYVAPGYSPRIEWGPDGERKGLLIEGASTNLLLRSSEFHLSPWSQVGTTSVTANAATAPDASLSAARVSNLSDALGERLLQTVYPLSPTTVTASLWVKGEGANIGKIVTFQTKRHTGTPAGNQVDVTLTAEWQRVSVPLVMAGDNNGVRAGLTSSGAPNEADSVLAWGAQLETKPYATSYIPTTTAQVTRAADVAKIEGAALSSWLQQEQGTLFVVVSGKGLSDSLSVWALALSDGTINNRIGIYTSASLTRGFVGTNGATQAIIPGPGLTGEPVKMALSYGPNDVAFAQEGSLVGIDTSAAISQTVDQLTLGAAYNNISHLDGHIRDFRYFPKRLSNEALQALTAL